VGRRGRGQQEDGGKLIRSFIICTLRQILLRWWRQGGWSGRGM